MLPIDYLHDTVLVLHVSFQSALPHIEVDMVHLVLLVQQLPLLVSLLLIVAV